MKNRSFRLLRVILAVIIIAASAPLTALAVEEISSVSLTVHAPSEGAHPGYEVKISRGQHYYRAYYNEDAWIDGVSWYDLSTFSYIEDPEDYTFEPGHRYQIFVKLVPEEGYVFSSSVTVRVNNQSGAVTGKWAESEIMATRVFDQLPGIEIPTVSVTLDAPAVGASPDYDPEFPDGAQYYNDSLNAGNLHNSIIWRDLTAGQSMNPGHSKFEAGHGYKVDVYLTARFEHEFTEDTAALVNGEEAECSIESNGELKVSCSFPALPVVLTRGDVNLDGKVDAADLTVLARHVSNISLLTDPQALLNADVTGGDGISASDLTKLARFVAHIEDGL